MNQLAELLILGAERGDDADYLDRCRRKRNIAEYDRTGKDTLREPVKDMPRDESSAWHIDFLSGGGEEDTRLYLKYYADEETRRGWLADFPDDEMPPHEEPPYDRDRHLPQAHSGAETVESDELM